MANTSRTSEQKPNAELSRGARCGPNWLNLRLGLWTMGIWTRTGGIGSNNGKIKIH